MAVSDQIERIKTNIANAYVTAETKGATMPALQNSENLSATIGTIQGGGTPEEKYGIIFDELLSTNLPKKVILNFPERGLPAMFGLGFTNVTHLRINEGPTSIQQNSLRQLRNLKLLMLPASVTKIDQSFGSDFNQLDVIEFKGTTPPTINNNETWSSAAKIPSIIVPDEAKTEYQAVFESLGINTVYGHQEQWGTDDPWYVIE